MTEQNRPSMSGRGTTTTRNKQRLRFVVVTYHTIALQTMSKPRPTATSQKPAPRHVLMEQSNGNDSNVSRGSGGTKTGPGGSRTRTSSGSQNENPKLASTGSNRSSQNKKQRVHVDAQHTPKTTGAMQGKSSTPVRSSAGYSSHPSQAGPSQVTRTHVHPTTTTSNSTPVRVPSGTPKIPNRTNSFSQHFASTPQSFQGFQSGASPNTSGVPDAICGKANDVSSVVTETNNASLYEQDKRDSKKEHELRMRQLKEYVRNSLFPYWKFFSNKKQMVFSNQEGGIVLKICSELHVRPDSQMYWWDLNKKPILDALNRKRNDVTAYLKKHFCGKTFCVIFVRVFFNHSVTKLLILTSYEIF